mmetsp:Transcript_16864/g.43212  ORF Transcript_16864/g.43212 Transcript_16864/m.43212 type:complete len:275 (-) Transcript_16864:247-1071(-)
MRRHGWSPSPMGDRHQFSVPLHGCELALWAVLALWTAHLHHQCRPLARQLPEPLLQLEVGRQVALAAGLQVGHALLAASQRLVDGLQRLGEAGGRLAGAVGDVAALLPKAQRLQRLVGVLRVHGGGDEAVRARVAAQRAAQQLREARLVVRHVRAAPHQRRDDLAQHQQAAVDAHRLRAALPLSLGLLQLLRAREVHQVQLRAHERIAGGGLVQRDDEDGVRAAGAVVHHCGGVALARLACEEHLHRVLHALDADLLRALEHKLLRRVARARVP